MRSRRLLVATVASVLWLSGCTSDDSSPQPAAAGSSSPAPTERPALDSGSTVWLCRPGLPEDACRGDLDTTVVAADGSRTTEPFRPARDPAFDCFYVYPTVSRAARTNAPRRITPELRYVARSQAALFGSQCRVFAPVYRQVTLQGLGSGGFADPVARATAYADVVAAWKEYLRRWNNGRPFLLLGHSQGTFALTSLIAEEIDDDAALRERMVSALLLGGAVTVASGERTGGSFDNVPACAGATETGCVVAYNTFTQAPPNPSLFGRALEGEQVVCVHPAAPAGGSATLTPYIPVEDADGSVNGFTAYADAVTARCQRGDGATWLHVRADGSLPDEFSTPAPGDAWGLHRVDVNIALGDLIALAATQFAALQAASG